MSLAKPFRLCLFGGSFNPPHLGHRALVEALLKRGTIDQIEILPVFKPTHKKQNSFAPFSFRMELCSLLFSDLERVRVSDQELRSNPEGYTYRLLEYYHRQAREVGQKLELSFLMGADSLIHFRDWKEPQRILQQAKIYLAKRPGLDEEAYQKALAYWRKYGEFEEIEGGTWPCSSSQIRHSFEQNFGAKPPVPEGRLRKQNYENISEIQTFLSPEVRRWILDYGLYAYPNWGEKFSKSFLDSCREIERELYLTLPRKRLLHSLSVYLLAVALADYFDLGIQEAAVASLLHDCAKCFSKEEMLSLLPEVQQICDGNPRLYHGPVGAVWAQKHFGVRDFSILEAIAWHTTLRENCSKLDELIFVADKLEPSRSYTDLAPLRAELQKGLRAASIATVRAVCRVLLRDGQECSRHSLDFLLWATGQKKEGFV